jgi:hypothetical protein
MNAQDILIQVSEKNPKALIVLYVDPQTNQGKMSFCITSIPELTYLASSLNCLVHDVLTGQKPLSLSEGNKAGA